MALATTCQTSGAEFHTSISETEVKVRVELPFPLMLTDEEAMLLEANIHNVMELVLSPLFR